MTENGIPVKQRMLEDIRKHSDPRGRVSISVEQLGKNHGLNGHDLAKNLDQLRTEGFVDITWGVGKTRITKIKLKRGAMNDSLLAQRRPALTIAERVRQWLTQQPAQMGGWVHVTPTQIRERLGAAAGPGNAVSVAISDMQARGELEVRKEGARIVSMRLAPKEPASAKIRTGATVEQIATASPSVSNSAVRATGAFTAAGGSWIKPDMPETPELEKYLAAKRVFMQAPIENKYLRIEFAENPIAEEALKLRKLLADLLGSNRHDS